MRANRRSRILVSSLFILGATVATPALAETKPGTFRLDLGKEIAKQVAQAPKKKSDTAPDAPNSNTTRATPSVPETVTGLNPVTTTATRSRRSIFETPANVDVVNRDDMDRRMQTTVEDLIRYLPGIYISRQSSGTDPFSSLSGITVRGVGGNRVQTLVDGSRVIERITDQTRDLVDLSNMKLVELVRGPASVLWGSDALGGVVAFVTKDPSDYLKPGQNYGFQFSNIFDSVNTSFMESITGAARLGSKLEVLLTYTRRDAGEVKLSKAKSPDGKWPCPRAPESQPCNKFDPTDISSNNLLGKIVYKIAPDNVLKLTGEFFRRVTDVDQLWDRGRGVTFFGTLSSTRTLDYQRQQKLRRFRIALSHEWKTNLSFLDSIKWQLVYHPQKVTRSGERLQEDAMGVRTLRKDLLTYDEVFYEADLQLKSSFDLGWMRHEFTYGFDGGITTGKYFRRDITKNLNTGVTTTRVAGGFNFANSRTVRTDAYIQDEISFFNKRLILTPGVRFAYYRITPKLAEGYSIVAGKEPRRISKGNLSFKIGAIFKLTKQFSVYAQYSEGFKMPTAQQLYTSLEGSFFNLVPNPNLRPERVKNYEVGLRGKFKKAYFSVNFFYARYVDFIQNFVFIPGTNDITYDNLARVKIWGFEGQARWRFLPEWEVTGAFSWQRGTQQSQAGAPKSHFNGAYPFKFVGGLRWTKPQWGLDVEFVGTYQAATTYTNGNRFRPPSYLIFDLTARWQPRPWITLHASVLNLFNTRYFLPSAVAYDAAPSRANVAATNPLELQTQPGRTFRLGLTMQF